MPGDRSRRRQEQCEGYREMVAQQGRVIVDRDVNALQRLTADQIERDALDFVGPCGTPDDGFAISVPHGSPPASALWSPPAFFDEDAGHRLDFAIAPGTMYVGGQRACLPGRQSGQTVHYSYFDQPDWLKPERPGATETKLATRSRTELVYLELTEQEVSAVEDPELLDVALGGPDTTQRVKLLQRIRRLQVSASSCTDAWEEAKRLWRERDGRRLDEKTMRLVPLTRLQVGFTQTLTQCDPCDPVASGGYFGADSQLVRVQLRHGQRTTLLWSYDNASFLYRITGVSDDRTMLTLAKDPPDSYHIPQTGQLVEVLRTAAILGKEPDETDPTGETISYRVVADSQGELRRLVQPFGPVETGDDTRYIVLDSPLPQNYAPADGPPIFLRVWNAELPVPAAGGVVALDDPASGASTGVEVTISTPANVPLSGGAFWEIALRPATPQGAYPEQLLISPQHPEGPRQWVCPLAVIDWSSEIPSVTDCRQRFDSLVELTKRRQGCCTVSVSPTDLAGGRSLQSFADRAASAGRGSKLCLSSGTYRLDAPLRLDSRHTTLTIEACGPAVVLRPASDAKPTAFSHGMIILDEAASVTLRGLKLFAVPAAIPRQDKFVEGVANETLTVARLTAVTARLRAAIGIRAINSANLTVENCSVALSADRVTNDIGLIGVSLFLQGLCTDVTVRNCRFDSQLGLTFHPAPRLVRDTPTQPPAPPQNAFNEISATPTNRASEIMELRRVSFGAMTERLGAVEAVAVQSRIVLTIGIAAVDSADNLPDDLRDTVIEDCHFGKLTFAAYGEAQFGSLRIERNRVDGCVSGFRFNLPDSVPPSESNAKALYNDMIRRLEFSERQMTGLLAQYPLPPDVQPPVERVQIRPGPRSIFFLANQVAALPQGTDATSAALNADGSAALVILANIPPREGADLHASLIMTSNNLRNRSASLGAPSVVLVAANEERSAITGNLIMNEGSDSYGFVIIPDSIPFVHYLAVTGNVIRGGSNLATLFRDPNKTQTWVPYNAASN